MAHTQEEKDRLDAIVEGHRQLIGDRYKYDRLHPMYNLPKAFNRKKVEELRTYFIEVIYPDRDTRQELDQAFSSLESHIKHPKELFHILLDSASLMITYGRHLPKIVKAGLRALVSYRSADIVEKKLFEASIKAKKKPPFSAAEINELMKKLPKRDLDKLVYNSMDLFEILFDRTLVEKIIEIIDNFIGKMKKKPKVYRPEEIRGIEWSRRIISEGYRLFYQFNDHEQQQLVDYIRRIERDSIVEIYAS